MTSETPFGNAIAWAHFQLRGGWKNHLATTIGYGVAIGAVILVTVRLNPRFTSQILAGWTTGLLVLQVGILILFGCGTVNTALRTDLSSRMIESHRLMPVSPPMAIVGYLLGSTSQVMSTALATFVIGLITNYGAGTPPALWLVPNLILAVFGAFLWIVSIFAGFVSRQAPRWLMGVVVALVVSRGFVLVLLPAVMVLSSPLIGHTIFERTMWVARINGPQAIAIAAQLAVGAILFIGAARKYRRDDAVALPASLGLLLVAVWVVISRLGIAQWNQFEPVFLRGMDVNQATQMLSSMIASMLLALWPVAASSRADALWQRHRIWMDPAPMRRPMPPLLAVLLSAAIVLGMVWKMPDGDMNVGQAIRVMVRPGIVVTLFLLSACCLLRMVHRHEGRGWLVVGAWIVLTWLGPFMIDLMRHTASTDPYDVLLSSISTCSPIGALIQLLNERRPLDTTVGLMVQGGLAALTVILFYATAGRRSGKATAGFPVVSPPSSKP